MKKNILLSLLAIIILLTACGTTNETQTAPELSDQTVSSTILPEQTSEVTPTPKPTTTPKPTASPTPIATATPAATPEPTPTPTAQPAPTEAAETLPVENLEGNTEAVDSSSVITSASSEAPAPETASTNQEASSGGNGNGSNFNTYDNAEQQNTEAAYVLNTNTMKIHHPSCKSVKKIAPQNYSTSNLSVDELIGQGYSTCGNCFK